MVNLRCMLERITAARTRTYRFFWQPGGEAVVNEERFGGFTRRAAISEQPSMRGRLAICWWSPIWPIYSRRVHPCHGSQHRKSVAVSRGFTGAEARTMWGTKCRFRASRPRPIVSASKASEKFCPVMFGAPLLCRPRCFLRLLPAAGTWKVLVWCTRLFGKRLAIENIFFNFPFRKRVLLQFVSCGIFWFNPSFFFLAMFSFDDATITAADVVFDFRAVMLKKLEWLVERQGSTGL